MQLTCVIPIDRDLRKPSANDLTHAWLDFRRRSHFTGRHPCGYNMETVLIVLVVFFLLGGGGWGYSRWRG
jgi:hypothetical protein